MNTRRSAVLALTLTLLATAASAQDIQYEKYQLDNGMTVILHEDHSLPVAAINFWYHVGSKDEQVRRSGFAHLFEHLMFMGTERVPGSQFDLIMEGGGGSNNASTSSDRTNYFSSGPRELLPVLLWLDADRLEDLARTMDQEKLDKQRDVVRNERRQSYENAPYGKAELKIQEMMYPPGHPYHIPVIGTHEDLEAATVADVKDFFATYYVPRNVTLVVAGDFNSAEIKPLIKQLYGTLPGGVAPDHRTASPARLDEVKRATVLDKVQLPMISFSYHSPAIFAEGDAEMDLAASVLTDGKTSRLYKRLIIDEQLAADVSAYQGSAMLGSEFRVSVMATPDANLDRLEQIVDEELAKFVKDGPTAAELEQRKASFELNMLRRLQSVLAKADQLNAYNFHLGEPNSFKRDLDRYRNATPQSVRSWAEKVLTPHGRVIMRVLPETPEREATPRDERPSLADSKTFEPRLPEEFKLSNGVSVMLWQKSELPLVAQTILFNTGGIISNPQRAGSVYLAADMLDEGAGDLDALAFGDAMQSLGATFNTGADHEAVFASLTVLKRNFERAAELAADALRRPTFTTEDWERVKRVHLDELRQQDDEPGVVAGRVAARMYFGAEHPYGWPAAGTTDTVENLALEDVTREYNALVRPEFATILLAGDISAGEARTLLERTLGNWEARPRTVTKADLPKRGPQKDLQVYIVDRPDAVQTVIRFALPGPTYTTDRRVDYRLLNTLLGGSFTSRLNMNLREQHGYTYGARSAFVMEPSVGYFTASSNVRADVTGESLKEFLHELTRAQKGDITPEEAGKAQATLRADIVESFAGLNGVINEASQRVTAGLPFASVADDINRIPKVKDADLNAMGQEAIQLQSGVLVLVGDKKAILPQIESLVPTPVEVDVRGQVVGSGRSTAGTD